MATFFYDRFFEMDPANPPAVGTPLTALRLLVEDNNDDGDIERKGGDQIDGTDISSAYPNSSVTVINDNGDTVVYVGVTFHLRDGRIIFSPTDTTNVFDGTFVSSSSGPRDDGVFVTDLEAVLCFTPGVRILTPKGHRAVENLRVGDLVITKDHGERPLRWIGRRSFCGQGALAPIRFEKRAIGNRRAFMVSPQHRMLLTGWRAELFFGEDEILVAARHLVDGHGITVAPCETVDYIHLMFDEHEVIFAEGVATESLHPGDYLMDGDSETARELRTLFPELDGAEPWPTARKVLRSFEARVLARDAA